jgi:arylformamidase
MHKKMIFIDLTHLIKNEMPCFKAEWHCKTSMQQMGSISNVGRNTTKLLFGSHCGTHIDAPAHFIKDGRTIDQIGLDELVGPVSIFDFSHLHNNEEITVKMLENLTITPKIIFYFNWAKYFHDQKSFYSNYPFISDEACDFLIEKKVRLIGMDTPSPDDSRIKLGSENDSKIHKKLLSANIILIEYLNNLDKLNDYSNWIISAMPLKLENCDGSPARVCLFKEK